MAENIKSLAEFGYDPMKVGMQQMQLANQAQRFEMQEGRLAQAGEVLGERERYHAAQMEQMQNKLLVEQQNKNVTNQLAAIAELRKGPLTLEQNVELQNRAAELMGMDRRYSVQELATTQTAFDHFTKTFAQFGPEHPATMEAANHLMNVDPVLHQKAQAQVGMGQLAAEAKGGPVTAPQAAAVAESKELQQEVGKTVFRPKDIDQARVNLMQAKVGELQAHKDYLYNQSNVSNARTAFYNAHASRQVVGKLKDYAAIEQMGVDTRAKEAKLQELLRSQEGYEEFQQQKPQLLQQITQQEATYQQDVASLEKQIAATDDPVVIGKLRQEMASRQLLLRSLGAERRYVNAPTPDNFKVYKQADAAVNGELQRTATMLTQGRRDLGLAQQKFDVAQQNAQALAEARRQALRSDRSDEAIARISEETGADPAAIKEVFKDPNKALVNVQNYDPKQSIEEANKLVNTSMVPSLLQDVRGMVFDKKGGVNRLVLAEAAPGAGIPFTQGRELNTKMAQVIDLKLRLSTGQAATEKEMQRYLNVFGLSALDNDKLIKHKIEAFEKWSKAVVSTTDPGGELRKRAEEFIKFEGSRPEAKAGPKQEPAKPPASEQIDEGKVLGEMRKSGAIGTADDYLKSIGVAP